MKNLSLFIALGLLSPLAHGASSSKLSVTLWTPGAIAGAADLLRVDARGAEGPWAQDTPDVVMVNETTAVDIPAHELSEIVLEFGLVAWITPAGELVQLRPLRAHMTPQGVTLDCGVYEGNPPDEALRVRIELDGQVQGEGTCG
ncbi:MAG: hypothetical protein H6740_23690 [Alphaproteobacteria bacterium]|nr:hypothetical protein [Alphaproteobacteria bacterium]